MSKSSEVVEEILSNMVANPTVTALNLAFTADPGAIHALICNRVPCNSDLAADPFTIVESSEVLKDAYSVGALGLINGVLAANKLPLVAYMFSNEEPQRFLGFCEYKPEKEPANAPAQS